MIMAVISTNNAVHYSWGENCDGWHLLNSESLSVIEESVPPNAKEQRHYHHIAQQFFYVLEGVATIEVAGELFEIRAREGLGVLPKEPHQLMNNGSVNLRFLVISQPISHGDRVNQA